MKTEFIEYLESLKYYDQAHHSRLLLASKQAVMEALKGNVEKLRCLFFDFPFYYDVPMDHERKVICVVQQSKKERWIQKYANLISQGDFELTYDNARPHVTASFETSEKVSMLNADILITACVDLLDEKSQLKVEVIEFFGLQELLAHHQNDAVMMKKIICHIIYSYWMEIVTVNLGMIAIRSDCNVVQLECLTNFSKRLLLEQKEFTPFFMSALTEYEEKFSTVDFAAFLRDLPVDRISGIMSIASNRIGDSEDMSS
jgi:hypothetical protein